MVVRIKKMTNVIRPKTGEKIKFIDGKLEIPNNPIIPFIEGDGIGPDIWASAVRVLDSAVKKAYDGKRKIHWMEVYAGEKANEVYGDGTWLPQETLDFINEYLKIYKEYPIRTITIMYDLVGLLYYLLLQNDFEFSDKLFKKDNKFIKV